MANADELNFAMAVLQLKAQRDRDKIARAQEQETMARERELFRVQQQQLQLALDTERKNAERLEAQRAGLSDLTTAYLEFQSAKAKGGMTGGGSVTSTYKLDAKGRRVLDDKGQPMKGEARTVTAAGESVEDRARKKFQEVYMRVAQQSPEAVAVYAKGFEDFDKTLVPVGMGVAAGAPSLDARKKQMDLLFDGYKILEKELAPETPDMIQKRGEEAIKATQSQTADIGRAIGQQIDLLGLGLSSADDAKAAVAEMAAASKGPSAGTSVMDSITIDMQNKIATFSSQASKVVKPGTYQEEVFRALQKNMAQLGNASSFMLKQRQQVEDQTSAVQQKLEYGNLIYNDKVGLGMDHFMAARESTRETNDLFGQLAALEKQLNLDSVFVNAKRADATEEQTRAALDLIQSKVAQQLGTRDVMRTSRVHDILAKRLFGAQAAAVQAGWQLPVATPALPSTKPGGSEVPAPGTKQGAGGWGRTVAPKPTK